MQTERVRTGWASNEPCGGLAVDHDGRDGAEGRGHGSRRRRRRERREAEERERERDREAREEILLDPQLAAYQRARRVAEEKTRLASDVFPLLLVAVPLLIFAFPIGLFVLIFWGVKPAKRAYRLFVEPEIRERFVATEVEKQVHATLTHERRHLEAEHARSMQQLSANIAHEIRNPITAAKSLVQQMEEDPAAASNVEYARVALEELERVERSVSHLLRFARDEEMGFSELRLADVIASALETFRDRLERSGIRLEQRLDCEGALRGDAEKLRRVLINLVGNAIDALEEAQVASPRIEISMGENLAGTEVWVRVRDNGPGIDAEARERLFSPFYTSKASGTGLGLAISRKLVDAHGGSIEVGEEPGGGAEFLVVLPKRGAGKEGA